MKILTQLRNGHKEFISNVFNTRQLQNFQVSAVLWNVIKNLGIQLEKQTETFINILQLNHLKKEQVKTQSSLTDAINEETILLQQQNVCIGNRHTQMRTTWKPNRTQNKLYKVAYIVQLNSHQLRLRLK